MSNMRDIRNRIRSVKNIEQITKAMKMVASAKLQKAQQRASGSEPFMREIREVLGHFVGSQLDHPLMKPPVKPAGKVAYILVTSDKGLAGAYSSNAIKELLPNIINKGDQVDLFAVGRKGCDYFIRRGYHIENQYLGCSERPDIFMTRRIANELTCLYLSGKYDTIHLVYTQYYSPAHHVPKTIQYLPIPKEDMEALRPNEVEYEYESSQADVIDWVLPTYLKAILYGALLQSSASELGARMTAMSAATDNAKDLLSSLTLHYNKVRQAGITREITEIVGGAEALQ